MNIFYRIKIVVKKLFFFLSIFSICSVTSAQELYCVVKVNAKQIQGTETRIYENMEKDIYEFMNNTRWTTDVFKAEERIECSIFITLNNRNSNIFSGTIQISSRRPVYNTSYYSTMFNHFDEFFSFSYTEFAPLEFNQNSHISNLTSVLAFYAYIIIGLDYDSYELKGGSKYLDLAQKIVNNAQSEPSEGWKAFESDKNRYWLAENLNNDFYSPIRECYYNYHFKGLDLMQQNTDEGRKVISTALNGLEKIHQARPSSYIMKVFFNAKADEVINIFSEGLPPERNQISVLCTKLDPGNAAKYDKIVKQQ